jgi:hypothetical protein
MSPRITPVVTINGIHQDRADKFAAGPWSFSIARNAECGENAVVGDFSRQGAKRWDLCLCAVLHG